MSEQILFYSKKCPNCKKLFDLLQNAPRLKNNFLIICIDDKRYNIPKCIRSVPSAIVSSNIGQPQVFSGTKLFNYIKSRIGNQEQYSRNQGNQQQPVQRRDNRGETNNINTSGGFKEVEPEIWDSFVMGNLSDKFSFIDENKNNSLIEKSFASLNNIHNFKIYTPDDDGMKNKGDVKPVSYSMDDPNLRIPQNSNSNSSNPFAENHYENMNNGGGGYQESRTQYNPNEFSGGRGNQNGMFDSGMFRDRNYDGGSESRSSSRKSDYDAKLEQYKNSRDLGIPTPLRRF